MCFIWGVRGGGTRRGNWTSREGEGTAREGEQDFFSPSFNKPRSHFVWVDGEIALSPGSPAYPAVISGRAQPGRCSVGSPRRRAGWGRGDPSEEAPHRPHTAHHRPGIGALRVGYPRTAGSLGPPGARLTFSQRGRV